MSLSSALYAGLSGMAANSQILSVTGNNLANVGTTAYKDTEANFQTQISQTLNQGTAPTNTLGGTNPQQIGLGTQLEGMSTNFSPGTVQTTGVDTDLALSGNGFFIVNSDGATQYTRAGDFSLNANNYLVDANGNYVQGYTYDPTTFQTKTGDLTNLSIPVGSLQIADPTANVAVTGSLNASGVVASTRATTTGQELYSDDMATTAATGSTLLTGLYNASGNTIFAQGDTITLSGVTQGSTTLDTKTLTVGTGTTYGDLANFIQSATGINTSITGDPAGVTIAGGQLTVVGNDGTANDITLNSSDLSVTTAGNITTQPLTFTKTGANNGESVTTSTQAYDSLGTAIPVNLTFVLENAGPTGGTTWRYYAESTNPTEGQTTALGTGTVSFNSSGQYVSASNNTFTLYGSSGADPSTTIALNFSGNNGAGLNALSTPSQIAASSDGGAPGTLQSFSVGTDGVITGTFSNSQTKTLGQVVLANFVNPQGLSSVGGNNYQSTAASGSASIVTAGTGGTGGIVGSALEESNVDLSTEFVQLISATTGFSANTRVITTGDTMIQQLLTMIQ